MSLYCIVYLRYRFTEGPNAHCLFVAVFPVIILFLRLHFIIFGWYRESVCHSLEYVDTYVSVWLKCGFNVSSLSRLSKTVDFGAIPWRGLM